MPFVLAQPNHRRRPSQDVADDSRPAKLRRKTAGMSWQQGRANPTRPLLAQSDSSRTLLGTALDIFSRRPRETGARENSVPELDERGAVERGLPQMPSLLSLSSYIRRSHSTSSSTIAQVGVIHPLDSPVFSSTASAASFPFPSTGPPELVSPTDSEFSDASTLVTTPKTAKFPSKPRARNPSGERASWADIGLPYLVLPPAELEEDGGLSCSLIGLKSPCLGAENEWFAPGEEVGVAL